MTSLQTETCWALIRGAADGHTSERDEFARRYLPTVRAYLAARWANSHLLAEIDDFVQEVFVACFRDGGALQGIDSKHGSGFRAFLYGVTRNVALHAERASARRAKRVVEAELDQDQTPADEPSLTRVFDRAYAQAIVREARAQMRRRAERAGAAGLRRVELLRLRFQEGLPIRKIADLWNEEPARLHKEYAKAGREFKSALAEVVAESEGCAAVRVEAECERLLDLLRV